jgi:hypothetical protein
MEMTTMYPLKNILESPTLHMESIPIEVTKSETIIPESIDFFPILVTPTTPTIYCQNALLETALSSSAYGGTESVPVNVQSSSLLTPLHHEDHETQVTDI